MELKQSVGYAVGDLHGNFKEIQELINMYGLGNCAIIFCGDIGLGFREERYYKTIFRNLNKILEKKNIDLVFFRGNHDNPDYFDGEHNYVPRIHIIKDYTVLSLDGKLNILCVGGGISVDRRVRKMRNDLFRDLYIRTHKKIIEKNITREYWENEAPYLNNEFLDNLNTHIDVVCTHTCPKECYPFDKESIKWWLKRDDKLSSELDSEREIMSQVYKSLLKKRNAPREWFYGHYHDHYEMVLENEYNKTKFYMMNCANKYDIKRIMEEDKNGNMDV